MKTINDFVKQLNSYKRYGEFYIEKRREEEYILYKRFPGSEDVKLFCFAKEQPHWSIYAGLGTMSNELQEHIMDFVYNTDRSHWFDEPSGKKYNIIIGEHVWGTFKAAYYKIGHDVNVTDTATEYEFALDQYQFTESEIEDLKATLPENMAKIVDLGKVEVKDD